MKLHTLLSFLGPFLRYPGDNPVIKSIENDSRQVTQGSLFICIKGYTVDGHDFAQSAVANGAVAVLSEKELSLNVPVVVVSDTTRAMAILADAFFDQPSQNLYLIGVTGTNGKTTTSHIIEKIFSDNGVKTGIIGTMYTKIGDKTYDVKNTTPESLTLHKTLRKMINDGVKVASMEVSSHALVNGRVHGCDFDVAVFTNLTQDHLDYHKTMDEYRRAKGLLFSQLGNVFNHSKPKYAILNADDPVSKIYKSGTAARVLTYGIDTQADVMAENIEMTSNGTSFNLLTPIGKRKVLIKLVGKFSVYNVLASVSAAIASGMKLESIINSIETIKGVAGRFELVDAGQDYTVIVDYSHTPDSLENVLKTIKQFAERQIFVVVGCGGDRDRTKRPLMSNIACQYGTDVIFTSDNPRSEDPLSIIKDMEEGVTGQQYSIIVDRREAIRYAIKKARKGDVVLIAGKGHETYQQIQNKIFNFDDRLVAKEVIEER